jgi:putative transposase
LPRISKVRGVQLLTVGECASFFQVSESTIRRRLRSLKEAQLEVYLEEVSLRRRGSRGATTTLFIDPMTLGFELSRRQLVALGIQPRMVDDDPAPASSPVVLLPVERKSDGPSRLDQMDLEVARRRLELLRPILQIPRQSRAPAVEELARAERVSARTVYRWIRTFQDQGLIGLADRPRADIGRPRVPPEAYAVIKHALVDNPVDTSAAMVHRTLLRAVPQLMEYERGGKTHRVSKSTVERIKRSMLDHPTERLLFYDADAKKEFLRTWSGSVLSTHANDMWQMDMTRCDVEVLWVPELEEGQVKCEVARPRIHSIIDVYSGCIPGLAFSREEDQTQTDLAILNALLPKRGDYADKYPVWGRPNIFYADNGKTYVSEQTHRSLADLGVEVRHSMPGTSNTRGKVERGFGTVHNFEKSLPGYVGTDATTRSTEELKRLRKNTLAWAERGFTQDPGWGNRLLTINEYQNAVLAWIIGEYHQWIVDGKSRLQHFLETVPARSQALPDEEELFLVMAHRIERTVRPNGMFRIENRLWMIPDGSLTTYQGLKVLVLKDQFAPAARGQRRLVVYLDKFRKLTPIGWAVPASEVADSIESADYRRNSRAVARRQLNAAEADRRSLASGADLNLRVSTSLLKEAAATVELLPAVPQRARIAAVNPPDPREDLPDDDFTRFLTEAPDYGTDDPHEFYRRSKARRQNKEGTRE